ncbi:MAG: DUF2789 domain-containing protein [Sphingobacteriales bacterium]|nr:MAG: DUF2789 domain-containing protein [Sphingobacteriales bacterium]
METHSHAMSNLFDQLGLPSDEESIQQFIADHSLVPETTLFDADFWTDSQSRFLRDQIKADADWAVVIDTLDTSLRK